MTGASALRYGLLQEDEFVGSGVFNNLKLVRGESPAADATVTTVSATAALAAAYYLSHLRLVDGIVRFVDN